MVFRQCYKCKVIFNRKSTFDNHMNRKTDCSQNINNDLNDNSNDLNDNSNDLNDAVLCGFVQNSCRKMHNEIFLKNPNYSNILKSDLTETKDYSIDTNDYSINTNNMSFYCSYCHKNYSSKSVLSRHLKDNCKIKKENDEQKENIFKLLLEKDKQKDIEINELKKQNKMEINELKKQNKILMDKIDKLMKEHSKPSKIINDNKTITNNLSNTNNYVMVNFGKEDLSIIDERLFIDRIIKKNNLSGVKIPDEVLKIIHFNPMYPQLSNIYISDINRDKCMVYDDGEWKLSNIDNVPQIMDKICIFSNDQINNLREKHPNNKPLNDRLNIIEKYNNMIDDNYIQDLKDDDEINNKSTIKRCEDFQKHAYNTLKKTLYNEGKKIKKQIK